MHGCRSKQVYWHVGWLSAGRVQWCLGMIIGSTTLTWHVVLLLVSEGLRAASAYVVSVMHGACLSEEASMLAHLCACARALWQFATIVGCTPM